MRAIASTGSARTLGIYSCPAGVAGHVIFDLELGTRRIVSSVFERATPFVLDTVTLGYSHIRRSKIIELK